MVAFDLDGTVLDDEKRLAEDNRRSLAACVENGVYIVPCTGRLSLGIPKEILDIGVRYAVTVNGALVLDLAEGQCLDRRDLDKETAMAIVEFAHGYPRVMCDAFVDGRGISEPRYYDHLDHFGLSAAIQKMVRDTRTKVPDLLEYMRRPEAAVNKLNLYFEQMAERDFFRERLNKFPKALVTSSVANNLEVNGVAAEKGPSLLRLAGHLGIARQEILAIGDGENDISMIKAAGVGVAMDNSGSILKSIADYVTGNNNAAGVAQAIDRLVLS